MALESLQGLRDLIIPPEVTGYKAGVSSQPVSLADRLIGEYLRLSHLFECVSV